jgi:hypothetical protein
MKLHYYHLLALICGTVDNPQIRTCDKMKLPLPPAPLVLLGKKAADELLGRGGEA